MRVLSVNILNLDKLYDVCVTKVNEGTLDTKFGYNIFELYNNIEISFGLADVSPVDAFFLKEMSSKCTDLINTTLVYDNLDYETTVRRYAKYIHEIMNESSINSKEKWDYPYNYGPMHIIRGEMAITLAGYTLLPILSEDPSNFFLQATSGTCADNNSGPITFKKDFDLTKTNITAFLAKLFIDVFNRKMNSKFSSSDVLSDTGLYKYFIQHEEFCKLVTIRNPYLAIDIRTTSDTERKEEAEAYKQLMKTSYAEYNKIDLLMTEFEVNCYTRMSTFLNLYMLLPKNFFTVIEDFRVPFSFKEIYIPADYPENVASTLTKRYSDIQTTIDTMKTSAYNKVSHTYFNSMISYTIKVSLNEINLFINQLIKTRPNDITVEGLQLLKNIINISKDVYRSTH